MGKTESGIKKKKDTAGKAAKKEWAMCGLKASDKYGKLIDICLANVMDCLHCGYRAACSAIAENKTGSPYQYKNNEAMRNMPISELLKSRLAVPSWAAAGEESKGGGQ